MVEDLPDYTKYIVPNVAYPELIRPFGTKAECVTHLHKEDSGLGSVILTLDAAPIGEKIGLILVFVNSDHDDTHVEIETKQGGLWTDVLDDMHVNKNEPFKMRFPCWVPTQDLGDGVTQNLRIRVYEVCATRCTAFCLYYFE